MEVPVNFETRGADLQDYMSFNNLHQLFGVDIYDVLLTEDIPCVSFENKTGADVSRLIIKKVADKSK